MTTAALGAICNSLKHSQNHAQLEADVKTALVFATQEEYDAVPKDYTRVVDVVIVAGKIIKSRVSPPSISGEGIPGLENFQLSNDQKTDQADTPEETLAPTFHELAMRTAAGPENWFPDKEPFRDPYSFESALYAYFQAARDIDRWKSLLIYGKVKDEAKFDTIPNVSAEDISAIFKTLGQYPELVHAILGMASEAGELVEHLYTAISTKVIDIKGVNEETGDTAWFMELLAKAIDIPVDQSRIDVIDKLAIRYPDKFTDYHAEARLDKE